MITDDQMKARLLHLDTQLACAKLVQFAEEFEPQIEIRRDGSEGAEIYGYEHYSASFKLKTFQVLSLIGHVQSVIAALDAQFPELKIINCTHWSEGLVEGDFGISVKHESISVDFISCTTPRKSREDGLWSIFMRIPLSMMSPGTLEGLEGNVEF